MAVTIKDVAALAGVSPSTVSRVCSDSPSISRETKEKVRRAMAQIGYEPAIIPAAPSKTVRLIGIVLPPSEHSIFENAFYLEAIRGISQYCNQHQYASTIITGQNDSEVLDSIRSLLRDHSMDGFVMLYSRRDDPVVDFLCEAGLLYVVIGKANQLAGQTICIDNDNLTAGREAAEYLFRLGHRRIGYLGYENVFLFSSDRKSGYQLALLQQGLPMEPGLCVEIDPFQEEHLELLRNVLRSPGRPTAFVVSDDILAVALEHICVPLGLSIPEDISIISFNNSILAMLAFPQLTSVDINAYQLGFEAAAQLINHAENPNLMSTKIIVPHTIVERSSCRRLLK